jgi:hypothetical protein
LSLDRALEDARDLFQRLDQRITAYTRYKADRLGISDEVIEESKKRILDGEERMALHSQRRLKKRERVVRLYRAPIRGGFALVFETEDGELWQLSDVGMAWTPLEETESDWSEVRKIMPYLPATINPRPNTERPFQYSIELANGGTLHVSRKGDEVVCTVATSE